VIVTLGSVAVRSPCGKYHGLPAASSR